MVDLELKERFDEPIVEEIKRESIEEREDKIDLWLMKTLHDLKVEKELVHNELDTLIYNDRFNDYRNLTRQ